MIVFGYKEDGSAALFNLAPGEVLPPEWSSDIGVIADGGRRTAEAITLAAGDTCMHPLPGVPAVQTIAPVKAGRK